jgi:hypothetical protein
MHTCNQFATCVSHEFVRSVYFCFFSLDNRPLCNDCDLLGHGRLGASAHIFLYIFIQVQPATEVRSSCKGPGSWYHGTAHTESSTPCLFVGPPSSYASCRVSRMVNTWSQRPFYQAASSLSLCDAMHTMSVAVFGDDCRFSCD